jgi:xylan 1,4-beta-xylosidase
MDTRKLFLLFILFYSGIVNAALHPATFTNPVLCGFYPDPSICRVGEDYYLVTSSFEWYPGIPIFHSKNLMEWEQIGYVLDRPSQLRMEKGLKTSAGLWAPTIRYHDGKYYVINTAKQAGGNYYVYADKPEGPYSDPVFLTDAPGIDPSLFFDDDGTCWYTGSINDTPKEDRYPSEDRIYLQKLDLQKGVLVGERTILTTGHATNSPYAEAPHIYKINGRYYLMIAEGGTWNNHAITIFTSDKVTGPYLPGIANPVMTHRHLGGNTDIAAIGHGDLVQTSKGDWWCVMLGTRPIEGLTMLGRETFLTPVRFENGWPVFNPGVGRVLMEEKSTGLPDIQVEKEKERDDFSSEKLSLSWNFLRTPFEKWYQLKKGLLQIRLRPERVEDPVNPSLIARRVQHIHFHASLSMTFSPQETGEEAGMIVMQNGKNHYRLVLKKQAGKDSLILIKTEKGIETVSFAEAWNQKSVILRLEANKLRYQFYVGKNEQELHEFGAEQDASINSSNKAGGFTGPFIGMYASSNGKDSRNNASFDWFEYKPVSNLAYNKLPVKIQDTGSIIVRDPYNLPVPETKTYYVDLHK